MLESHHVEPCVTVCFSKLFRSMFSLYVFVCCVRTRDDRCSSAFGEFIALLIRHSQSNSHAKIRITSSHDLITTRNSIEHKKLANAHAGYNTIVFAQVKVSKLIILVESTM